MLVTSNPYFEFHKDVFPNFAKNAVERQILFPQSGDALDQIFSKKSVLTAIKRAQKASSLSPPYPLTILPDFPFSSFDESLFHISSFELDFYETQKLTLDLKQRVYPLELFL